MLETQEQFSVNVLLNRVNANARTALAGDRTGVAFDPSKSCSDGPRSVAYKGEAAH
jgi:hypothetical protein